ncbi:HTH-type transcriptional regulator GntR [Acetobacter papayae]|uniref:LacI family DNA-binding transcriptional regulator n=1 Tax=Acetobacter papayae TaxID=1076592 RepID=UPI000471A7F3|nr:LacI family DNA-binding transcriptional regulator [Acetobacter papayae]
MAGRKARSPVKGRATIKDVAAAANTSMISVSRAFRETSKVSPALRARIEQAAATLGYVPDRAASALASSRSMNVAVLIPSITNMVFMEVIAGINDILSPEGYQLITAATDYSPVEEHRLLRGLLSFRPDGVLLCGTDHLPQTFQLLTEPAVPVVHMMELHHRPDSYSVGFSQEGGGAAVAHHFLERGYERVGFVASQLDPRTMARGAGFQRVVEERMHVAPYVLTVPDRSSIELGARLTARALQECPDLNALFFCNDDLAQGALFYCQRHGINVPQQLAIAGFNDLPASAWIMPALSTVATPRYEIGRESAKMLVDLMLGNELAFPRLDLGFTFIARESS